MFTNLDLIMTKRTPLISGIIAFGILISGLFQPVLAEEFPDKPVKIVVVDPPGSAVDTVARLLGEQMAKTLKQNVVVENRPGASGTIAANTVAKAKPDGYTILMTGTFTEGIVPFAMEKLPYDYKKDLVPMAEIVRLPFVLVVPVGSSLKSLQDITAVAKAKPQGLNVGGMPRGSGLHLAWETIAERMNVKSTYVPYTSSSQLETDTVNNSFDLAIDTINSARSFIESGRTRGLAITSKSRSPALTSVPTLEEAGLNGLEAVVWVGALAPAGMPADRFAKLEDAIIKATQVESVVRTLTTIGYTVTGRKGAELAETIRNDRSVYEPLVKRLGIKMN